MQNKKIRCRCLHCGTEFSFTEKELESISCCPRCENPGIPADPANDVTITINWQELRILVMWAERWAEKFLKDKPYSYRTLLSIASRIQAQCPELAKKSPLTLLAELGQLKEEYPSMEIHGYDKPEDLSLPGEG